MLDELKNPSAEVLALFSAQYHTLNHHSFPLLNRNNSAGNVCLVMLLKLK